MRRGRPLSSDPLLRFSVRINSKQLEWLALWSDNGQTAQLFHLLERAMLFWPAGPYAFGHSRKSSKPPFYNMGVIRPSSPPLVSGGVL